MGYIENTKIYAKDLPSPSCLKHFLLFFMSSKTIYMCVNERESGLTVKLQGVQVVRLNIWGQPDKARDNAQEG